MFLVVSHGIYLALKYILLMINYLNRFKGSLNVLWSGRQFLKERIRNESWNKLHNPITPNHSVENAVCSSLRVSYRVQQLYIKEWNN